MEIQDRGDTVGIQGEGSSMGTQGCGCAGRGGKCGCAEGHGECARAQGPGMPPADGGPTPAANPAVTALEVFDILLEAIAPGAPLPEEAALARIESIAVARIEGIARRGPGALLTLRALLASLSRSLRELRDLHARTYGLAETLGAPLAETCPAPSDMRSLARLAGRAQERARVYQHLYELSRACDACCEALRRVDAERGGGAMDAQRSAGGEA